MFEQANSQWEYRERQLQEEQLKEKDMKGLGFVEDRQSVNIGRQLNLSRKKNRTTIHCFLVSQLVVN